MATPGLRGRFGKSKLATVAAGVALVITSGLIPTAAIAGPNDPVDLPTQGLHEAVIDALNAENVDGRADRDPSDPVTEGEAGQLTTLVYAASGVPVNERIQETEWLTHFTGLKELDLRFHSIGSLEHFSGLGALEELRVAGAPNNPEILSSGTDFSPLAALGNLKRLNLPFNEISDVTGLVAALEGLEHLVLLQLQANGIVDPSPLAELEQLRYIALNSNEVSDVAPLLELPLLSELGLMGNRVADASPLGGVDPADFNYIYLHNQRIELPDARVGDTIQSPVKLPDGSQVSVDSTSDGFEAVGAFDWKFNTTGEKELTWEIENPFDERNPFSGTITQRIKPARIAVVPEAPQVELCGVEPVMVTPADTDGIDYEVDIADNGDGSYTVTVFATSASEDYFIDLVEDLPGWEYNAQHLIWTQTFTPDCDDETDFVIVTPEVPEYELCVDAEPVVVTNPDTSAGVQYQSRIEDNGDGTFTVTTLAFADLEQGVMFDFDALPSGWAHIGDGILEWSTEVTPDCDPDEGLPNGEDSGNEETPTADPEPKPEIPPLGADVTTLGIAALIVGLLGVGILVVRRKMR